MYNITFFQVFLHLCEKNNLRRSNRNAVVLFMEFYGHRENYGSAMPYFNNTFFKEKLFIILIKIIRCSSDAIFRAEYGSLFILMFFVFITCAANVLSCRTAYF